MFQTVITLNIRENKYFICEREQKRDRNVKELKKEVKCTRDKIFFLTFPTFINKIINICVLLK